MRLPPIIHLLKRRKPRIVDSVHDRTNTHPYKLRVCPHVSHVAPIIDSTSPPPALRHLFNTPIRPGVLHRQRKAANIDDFSQALGSGTSSMRVSAERVSGKILPLSRMLYGPLTRLPSWSLPDRSRQPGPHILSFFIDTCITSSCILFCGY